MNRSAVRVINAHPRKRVRKGDVDSLARRVIRGERKKVRELSVVFVNDRTITRLNRQFLLHNHATDVICFPLQEEPELEGEVYVNLDQAARQARYYGVGTREEIRRLIIHGILHLVGHDDKTRKKKQRMHEIENKYLEWKNHSS
jgi:probable rRNA maturation factor